MKSWKWEILRAGSDGGVMSITNLNIPNDNSFTDESMIELAKSCPNLEVLSVLSCSQLTDAFVQVLVEKCQNITSLDFSECKLLRSKSIEFLEKCKNSKIICVDAKLTEEGRKKLQEKLEKLKKELEKLTSKMKSTEGSGVIIKISLPKK
jgi:hypothetical protein